MPLVEFLRQFAEKKGATPSQVALAWLLAQKPFIVPIPGTRNQDHLNENLGALNVQLTPADLQEINTALSKITIHGGRMNPASDGAGGRIGLTWREPCGWHGASHTAFKTRSPGRRSK